MAVRIRVYPQTGALGLNGLNGGAVSASTYYNSKLQAQKQVSNLELGYVKALANEKIERARLEERLKNPYLAMNAGLAGAYGGLPIGLGQVGMNPLAMLGTAPMMGGVLPMTAGSGQTNVTNQTSTGSGNQTVTNSNNFQSNHAITQHPHVGWGGGWGVPSFGGGGLLSGLLGALI